MQIYAPHMIIKTFVNTYLQNTIHHGPQGYNLHFKINSAKTLNTHKEMNDDNLKHSELSFTNFRFFTECHSLKKKKNP